MREEALYVENLITEQSDRQNLDRVSFSLFHGEILGITGLNGSGLSTLSDVLTGRIRSAAEQSTSTEFRFPLILKSRPTQQEFMKPGTIFP